MFGVLLSVYLVPAAMGIIVTDEPATSTEYNYSYNVVDPSTGDTKSLHEVRRGDVVTGSYTVIDPDGTRRVVDYRADSRRGFKAVVHSEPLRAPIQRVVTDHFYAPREDIRYLNQYYSSRTSYKGHPLSLSRVINPTHNNNRQKHKNTDNKPTRYFIPANEIKTKTVVFKQGEYFAPNH